MAATMAVMATLAAPGKGGAGAFVSGRALRKLSSFCERYQRTRSRGKDVCSASLRALGPGGRRGNPGSLLSRRSALSTIASWDAVRASGCCRLCSDSSVLPTAVCVKALIACSVLSAALLASLRAALALSLVAASKAAASAALSTLRGALRITIGIVARARGSPSEEPCVDRGPRARATFVRPQLALILIDRNSTSDKKTL